MNAYEARLVGLRREERALFAQAQSVLALCLEPDGDLATCRKAAEDIALDLGGIEPAGHYIGARMVEVMSECHPHERIVACARPVQDFLPLYNEAARIVGGYVFDPALVERFARLWRMPGAESELCPRPTDRLSDQRALLRMHPGRRLTHTTACVAKAVSGQEPVLCLTDVPAVP